MARIHAITFDLIQSIYLTDPTIPAERLWYLLCREYCRVNRQMLFGLPHINFVATFLDQTIALTPQRIINDITRYLTPEHIEKLNTQDDFTHLLRIFFNCHAELTHTFSPELLAKLQLDPYGLPIDLDDVVKNFNIDHLEICPYEGIDPDLFLDVIGKDRREQLFYKWLDQLSHRQHSKYDPDNEELYRLLGHLYKAFNRVEKKAVLTHIMIRINENFPFYPAYFAGYCYILQCIRHDLSPQDKARLITLLLKASHYYIESILDEGRRIEDTWNDSNYKMYLATALLLGNNSFEPKTLRILIINQILIFKDQQNHPDENDITRSYHGELTLHDFIDIVHAAKGELSIEQYIEKLNYAALLDVKLHAFAAHIFAIVANPQLIQPENRLAALLKKIAAHERDQDKLEVCAIVSLQACLSNDEKVFYIDLFKTWRTSANDKLSSMSSALLLQLCQSKSPKMLNECKEASVLSCPDKSNLQQGLIARQGTYLHPRKKTLASGLAADTLAQNVTLSSPNYLIYGLFRKNMLEKHAQLKQANYSIFQQMKQIFEPTIVPWRSYDYLLKKAVSMPYFQLFETMAKTARNKKIRHELQRNDVAEEFADIVVKYV